MEQKQKDAEIGLVQLENPQLPDQSEYDAKDEAFTQYLQFFESIFSDKTGPNYMAPTQGEEQSKKEGQASKQKVLKYLERIQKRCYKKLRENQFHIARQTHDGQKKSELNSAQFQMKIVRHIVTWEVIELYCRLGPIFKKFIVLNSAQSLKENDQMYANLNSSYGNSKIHVYFFEFEQEPYVLKRVQFRKPKSDKIQFNNDKPQFQKVVKEYFIASVMSALQIGCYIKKVNGFDFIVHDSFIEFHMERCYTLDTALIEEQMKRNLLVMHSLKICHMDASPKNIMYSPTFDKWVFIDFGLSKMVKENIDEKSFTAFCGTYVFCSSDMALLFPKNSVGWVNLYLNDVWGLKESFEKMKKAQSISQVKIHQQSQIKICSTLLDTYRSLNRNILNLLIENMKKSDESAFQNLTTQKKYHKPLIIRICKFLVYCKYIYFWGQQIDITSIRNHQRTKKQAILNLPQSINQQLRTFAKIFDCFFDKEQLIKSYQQFYNETTELNEPVNIQNQIFKWYSFYSAATLPRNQQQYDKQKVSSNFQINFVHKFSNFALVQQSIYHPEQILTYLRYLFTLVDFTSFKAFATPELREKTFEIYFTIRTQLLQKILPSFKQIETNSNFYPSSLHLSQCSPEILKFYDDMLRVILESNDHGLQQSVQFELRSLILRHGFQILKNLIFLGFNCLQFIKDYLAICLMFLVKTEDLKKHLILIMVRQTIEIGLLLEHCEIIVEKGKNLSNISKHRLLNERIFDLMFSQKLQKLMENDKILIDNMRTIHKTWIFLNPQYARFLLSYKHVYTKYNSIKAKLLNEFHSLSGDQLIERAKVYEETLYIVKKILNKISRTNETSYQGLYMTKSARDYSAILQKSLDNLSQNISNANLEYAQLVFGKKNIKSLNFPLKQFTTIDAHFLIKASILSNHINLFQTSKIMKKVMDICQVKPFNNYAFFHQKLLIFNRVKMKDILSELLFGLINQIIETCSIIGILEKIVQMFRKHPLNKQVVCYTYLRLIWSFWIKSIEILAEQAKYWQKENIKSYQILYIRIVQNTIQLFQLFAQTQTQYRQYILNKPQNRKLINRTIKFYQTLPLLQQLESAMKIFQENSLKDPKISVFNQCILFQMKQIYLRCIQFLPIKYQWEYIPNLSWIHMQLSRLHKAYWQSMNFSSIGVRIQLGTPISRIRFLRFLSVQTMLKIDYKENGKVQEFNQLVKQIHNRSYMPESQNFLIHSLAIAYFHDINLHDSKIDILSFQNIDQAFKKANFYFMTVSKDLNGQLVDYLVENLIKLKYIPIKYVFHVYLNLFQSYEQYFDHRKEKKISLLRQMFSMLANNGYRQYILSKAIYLSHMYYQYLLCSNLSKRYTADKLNRQGFPPKIMRKIILYYAPLFMNDQTNVTFQSFFLQICVVPTKQRALKALSIRNVLASFIQLDQRWVSKKIINTSPYKIISKKLLNKRLLYIGIGMQYSPYDKWEEFDYIRKINNKGDYKLFQQSIKQKLYQKGIIGQDKKQTWQIFRYYFEKERRDSLIDIENKIKIFSRLSFQQNSIDMNQKSIYDKIKKIQYGDRPSYRYFPLRFTDPALFVCNKQNLQYYQKVNSTYQSLFTGSIRPNIIIHQEFNQQIDKTMVKYIKPLQNFVKTKSEIQRQIAAFEFQQDILYRNKNDIEEFLRLQRKSVTQNYQI